MDEIAREDRQGIRRNFDALHERHYGQSAEQRPVEFVNVRASAIGGRSRCPRGSRGRRVTAAATRAVRIVRAATRDDHAGQQCHQQNARTIDHRANPPPRGSHPGDPVVLGFRDNAASGLGQVGLTRSPTRYITGVASTPWMITEAVTVNATVDHIQSEPSSGASPVA